MRRLKGLGLALALIVAISLPSLARPAPAHAQEPPFQYQIQIAPLGLSGGTVVYQVAGYVEWGPGKLTYDDLRVVFTGTIFRRSVSGGGIIIPQIDTIEIEGLNLLTEPITLSPAPNMLAAVYRMLAAVRQKHDAAMAAIQNTR